MLGKFSRDVLPLTWNEIHSFSSLLEIRLEPWEAEALMIMSKSYCYVYHQAKEPNYPPPHSIESEEIQQIKAANVTSGFKALAARRNTKKRGL